MAGPLACGDLAASVIAPRGAGGASTSAASPAPGSGRGRGRGGGSGRGRGPTTTPGARSPQSALAAAAAGDPDAPPSIHLAPSLPAWRGVVGLCEDALSPHPLSGRALDALEAIAATRRTGVLRSDLGRQLGVELKNFHFVVNHLTERGAATATPVVARARPGAPTQTTSRLHLPRFAPHLASGQALREGYGWGNEAAGAGGGGAAGAPSSVRDDVSSASAVIARLAAIAPAATPDTDLKAMLGLAKGQAGARAWRRLRCFILGGGYARQVVVSTRCPGGGGGGGPGGGPPRPPTGGPGERLALVSAAPWDGGAALARAMEGGGGGAGEADGEGDAAGATGAGASLVPPACVRAAALVAEAGMDAHFLRVMLAAGDRGIPALELPRLMGLNAKKAAARAGRAAARFGVAQRAAQVGRNVLRVWAAPPSLVASHRATVPPELPPGTGSYLAALAAAVRGTPCDPFASSPDRLPRGAAAAATPTARAAAGAKAVEAPAPPAAPPPPTADPLPALSPTAAADLDALVADARWEADAAPSGGEGPATLPRAKRAVVTTPARGEPPALPPATASDDCLGPLQADRLRRLAAAVDRDGYMPRAGVGRFLRVTDPADAGVASPDRRSIARVVAAALARGCVAPARLVAPYGPSAGGSVAGGAGSGGGRTVAFLVRPGAVPAGPPGARAAGATLPAPGPAFSAAERRAAARAAFFGFRDSLCRARTARAAMPCAASAAEPILIVRTGPDGKGVAAGPGPAAVLPPSPGAATTAAAPPVAPTSDVRVMVANGYVRAACVRAQALHCWAVGEAVKAAAGGGGASTSTTTSSPLLAGGPAPRGVPAEDAVGGWALTLDDLLASLPLRLVCRLAGVKAPLTPAAAGGLAGGRASDAVATAEAVAAAADTPFARLPPSLAAAAEDDRTLPRLDALVHFLRRCGLVRLHTGSTKEAPTLITLVAAPCLAVPADDDSAGGGASEGAAAADDDGAPSAARTFNLVTLAGRAASLPSLTALWAGLRRFNGLDPASAPPLAARAPELLTPPAWRTGGRAGRAAVGELNALLGLAPPPPLPGASRQEAGSGGRGRGGGDRGCGGRGRGRGRGGGRTPSTTRPAPASPAPTHRRRTALGPLTPEARAARLKAARHEAYARTRAAVAGLKARVAAAGEVLVADPAGAALKKQRWAAGEDEALLAIYAGASARDGLGEPPFRTVGVPLPGTAADERQALRRLARLRGHAASAGLIASLDAEIGGARADLGLRVAAPPAKSVAGARVKPRAGSASGGEEGGEEEEEEDVDEPDEDGARAAEGRWADFVCLAASRTDPLAALAAHAEAAGEEAVAALATRRVAVQGLIARLIDAAPLRPKEARQPGAPRRRRWASRGGEVGRPSRPSAPGLDESEGWEDDEEEDEGEVYRRRAVRARRAGPARRAPSPSAACLEEDAGEAALAGRGGGGCGGGRGDDGAPPPACDGSARARKALDPLACAAQDVARVELLLRLRAAPAGGAGAAAAGARAAVDALFGAGAGAAAVAAIAPADRRGGGGPAGFPTALLAALAPPRAPALPDSAFGGAGATAPVPAAAAAAAAAAPGPSPPGAPLPAGWFAAAVGALTAGEARLTADAVPTPAGWDGWALALQPATPPRGVGAGAGPPAPPPPPAEGGAAALALPSGGLRPPWCDAAGLADEALWTALARRALCAVAAAPGLTEARLREAVGPAALSPPGLAALARALVCAGVLVRREVPPPAPACPPSLLTGRAPPGKRRRTGGEAVFFVAAGRVVARVAAPAEV